MAIVESCFLSGGNGSVEALPSAVRFAGYHINKRNVMTLQIRNRSQQQQRVHVLLPNTIEFDIQTDNKVLKIAEPYKCLIDIKGWIVPGLSITVRVIFRPTEWRHHHDEIIIRHNDGLFTVPLDAFPILSDAVFPRNIDMGLCPFQFEFTLTSVKTSTEFSVTPLAGIIPANGQVNITIQYHPLQCHTSEFLFQVQISQLFFEPFICQVSGSASFPNDDNLANVAKPLPPRKLTGTTPRNIASGSKTQKETGGKRLLPETINGIVMPERIIGRPSAVNFILSQIYKDSTGQQLSKNPNGSGKALSQSLIISEKDGNSDAILDNIDFSGRTPAERISLFELEYQKAVGFRKQIGNKKSWKRIGQRLLSDDQKKIIAERSTLLKLEFERQQIRSGNGSAIVCVPVGLHLNVQPSWDLLKSDRSIQNRRALNQLLLFMNKVVIRYRVDKRIEKMKLLLQEFQDAKSEIKDGLTESKFEAKQGNLKSERKEAEPNYPESTGTDDATPFSQPKDNFAKNSEKEIFNDLDEQNCLPPTRIIEIEDSLPDVLLFQIPKVLECDLKGYRVFQMDPFPGNIIHSVPGGFVGLRVGAQSEDPILETRPPSCITKTVNRPEDKRIESDPPDYITFRPSYTTLSLDTITEADPVFTLSQPMVVVTRTPDINNIYKENLSKHLTELVGEGSVEVFSVLPTLDQYYQKLHYCSDIQSDVMFEPSRAPRNDFENHDLGGKQVSSPSLEEAKNLFNSNVQLASATAFELARFQFDEKIREMRRRNLSAFQSRIKERLNIPNLHINFQSRPFIE